jgi:hypothetical protein
MRGVLTYEGGLGAAGATVVLRDACANSLDACDSTVATLQTVTDSTGAFTFQCRDTGAVVVEALDSNGYSAAVQLTITRQQRDYEITAQLRRSATLTGRVGPALGSGNTFVITVAGYRRMAADSLGRFSLVLPPGPYVLGVSDVMSLFVAQRIQIDTLRAGEARDIGRVVLQPR